MRIDKWLWAARFYKTRSLAAQELDKGRIQLNGHAVKPAHEIKPGDTLALRQGPVLLALWQARLFPSRRNAERRDFVKTRSQSLTGTMRF